MNDLDSRLLLRTVEIAASAWKAGNQPFGALLADESGEILFEAENSVNTDTDATGHAETNLISLATRARKSLNLGGATLYTSTEPCAMCCGAIYVAGIDRVVFAASKPDVLAIMGDIPTVRMLRLDSRSIMATGAAPVDVVGPAPAGSVLHDRAIGLHVEFWATVRSSTASTGDEHE